MRELLPIDPDYTMLDHMIGRQSRLHRLICRMLDTYIDDLTDERIEEIERLVDTYRITHANGARINRAA